MPEVVTPLNSPRCAPDMIPYYNPEATVRDDEASAGRFMDDLKVAVEESPIRKLMSQRDLILAWMHTGEELITGLDTMISLYASENDIGLEPRQMKALGYTDTNPALRTLVPEETSGQEQLDAALLAEGFERMDPAIEFRSSITDTLIEANGIPAPEDVTLPPDAELDATIDT